MVPPMSVMSRWESIRSMTGIRALAGSNSLELAPVMPSTLRAKSTVITCMPRQSPRQGTSFSRA